MSFTKRVSLICLSLVASTSFVRADVDSDEADFNPPAGTVRITDFSYAGTGCPSGTVLGDVSPDNEVITMIFSDYRVAKEGPQTPGESRKNCRMRFGFEAPAGWSHAVYSMTVQGYADLDDGLTGIQNLSYSNADGQGRNPLGKMKIEGPYRNDYVRSEKIELANLEWSTCQKDKHRVLIDSAIAIQPKGPAGRTASGLLTVDVLENVLAGGAPGKITQQFEVLWKRCPGATPAKRTALAMCKIQLVDRRDGKLIREASIKARAQNKDKALAKATKKAQKRCQQLERHRNGRAECRIETACTAVDLDEGRRL